MKIQFLVALAASFPLAAVAAGESVPCPQKKPGQWYRFTKSDLYANTTEQLTKIESVSGDRLFITQNGEPVTADKMHNWNKLGERTATPKYYVQIECPFSLGETRVYKDVEYDGEPGRKTQMGWTTATGVRGTITVTVAPAFETLAVKAGSFRVVKIVSENAYRATLRAEGDRKLGWDGSVRLVSYYAPEIGIWVKSESMETLQSGNRERYLDRLELVEYSLGN